MSGFDELAYARQILTEKNARKLLTSGPEESGTSVLVLRKEQYYSHYMPCVAKISHVTKSGRIAVDLWADGSERVVVSRKAVLWPPEVQP